MHVIYLVAFILLISAGCQKRVVQRVDTDKVVDLSGRWNDTDSRLVAEEMIKDVLSRPWIQRFEERNNRRPVIIIGEVKNRTHEHIDSEAFIKNLEREVINIGAVRIVQGAEFRELMREERADQQEFASAETMKRWRQEIGADYMMNGTINAITDQYGKQKTVYYQVNLELSDMETNEKVWIGEKKIKKVISN